MALNLNSEEAQETEITAHTKARRCKEDVQPKSE